MIHILEVDSVQLQFGQRKILSDIYFKCETGKITGLLGRNGVGKSCLMKIAFGSFKCEKSVRIDTLTRKEAFLQGHLGYLPQFSFIPRGFSLKNIFLDFGLDFLSFSRTFPEFSSKSRKRIGTFSSGERRIIEIYVILKSSFLFVMLDEPFTFLSPIQIHKVKSLLVDEKRNKGILISDHMYKHVIDIVDDLYILANGETHLTKNANDLKKLGYIKI